MGKNTGIEWTDHTFNPWWGCSHAGSPACDHCYAREVARRFSSESCFDKASRRTFGERHWNEPRRWDRAAARAGVRHKVFCGSMCDVLEDVGRVFPERAKLYQLIADTPNLDWLLLTKRPENAQLHLPRHWFAERWPSNVWFGTTVENANVAPKRLRALLQVPAPIRFVSAEPLLGEIDFRPWMPGVHDETCDMGVDCTCGALDPSEAINWVIVGGESGVQARPTDPEWVIWILEQCRQREVPLFFKQWGRWMPAKHGWDKDKLCGPVDLPDWPTVGTRTEHGHKFYAVGKRHAGACIGGTTYKEFPTRII
jgi:protein gp37